MAFVEPYSNYIIFYIYSTHKSNVSVYIILSMISFYQCWKNYSNLHVPQKLMNILSIGFLEKVFVFKCSPSLYWEKINETASIYHDMPYFVPA